MDDLEEIWHGLAVQMMKAHVALREIERLALTHEINSPATSPERRLAAIARRGAAIVEWRELITEDEELMPAEVIAAMDRSPIEITCPHCEVRPGKQC